MQSRKLWRYAINKSLQESSDSSSPYLNNGEIHFVWTPRTVPKLAYVVSEIMNVVKRKQASEHVSPQALSYKDVVLARRDSVTDHVKATRKLLRQYSSKLVHVPGRLDSESEPLLPLAQARTQADDVDKQASPSKSIKAFPMPMKEGNPGLKQWMSSGSPKQVANYDTPMRKESSDDDDDA